MDDIHIVIASILLLFVCLGLIRIFLGPTSADRMMAAQLFGTCGIAILLVLSKGFAEQNLLDIALVFALLAALVTITFVQRSWSNGKKEE